MIAAISVIGPSEEDRSLLQAVARLVSMLPDLSEDAVYLVQVADDIIRARRGFDFSLSPTGRTGEYRLGLKLSEALRDFCSAVGAGDLDGHFVGEVRHIAVSIGSVGPSDVKRDGSSVHGDARPAPAQRGAGAVA